MYDLYFKTHFSTFEYFPLNTKNKNLKKLMRFRNILQQPDLKGSFSIGHD
jgi:hypothetical protein